MLIYVRVSRTIIAHRPRPNPRPSSSRRLGVVVILLCINMYRLILGKMHLISIVQSLTRTDTKPRKRIFSYQIAICTIVAHFYDI